MLKDQPREEKDGKSGPTRWVKVMSSNEDKGELQHQTIACCLSPPLSAWDCNDKSGSSCAKKHLVGTSDCATATFLKKAPLTTPRPQSLTTLDSLSALAQH